MFNTVYMTDDLPLSSAKSVGFRAGPKLREELDAVARETKRGISDILRDGFVAYWPEIKALNYTLGRTATEEEVVEMRRHLDACQRAKRLGVDPAAALTSAIEAKLEHAAHVA
jgi:predicted DNA-binding protein